jgi:predicted ATPase/DNA-binding winged helix-turn-helix (wHTH) protein
MASPIDDDVLLGGRFLFRRRQGQLLNGGKRVAIGSRALEVLAVLAENAGEIVGKALLIERVWPETIVEENNLQVQISTLRKILGSDAIATVPGRGYRLCLALGRIRQSDGDPSLPADANRRAHGPGLLGRERDLTRVLALLDGGGAVTLTGPGGVGKTSLAREVARVWCEQSTEAVAWADLIPVSDDAMLVSVVAKVLGIEMPPDESSMVNLARLVKHRSMLLVLDNAEHLSDAVADAAATLAVDAELRLFITSREPLHIPNERVYRLSGLEVPETGVGSTEAMQAAAVALFVRCARNADANFAPDLATSDIAAICRRLDGLPLSIEMAASRVASLGVSGLKVALEQHWRLLTSRARATPLRHETLEATLDWSHALLHPDEQRTLRRLALFVNGFPLDAARAVTVEPGSDDWEVADALAGLIDKSLVVAETSEPPRYHLLQTVRAYALEKLAAAGELAMVRARLLGWLLEFFLAANESAWTTPDRTWVADVRPEFINLRSTLGDALDNPYTSDVAIRVIAIAQLSWIRMGELEAEPRALVDRALGLAGATTEPATRALLQFGRGMYYSTFDIDVSRQAFREAHELAESALGPRDRTHILLEYARVLTRAGDLAAAERALVEATRTSASLPIPTLRGLVSLAWAMLRGFQARPAEASEHAASAVTQFDVARAGTLAAMARNDLADHAWAAGDLTAAAALLRQIVDAGRRDASETTDRTGVPQMNLASVLAEQGDIDQALVLAHEALPLHRLADRMWSCYDCLSLIAVVVGDYDVAARLHGLSDAEYARRGIGMRETNESRLHARVARALREKIDPVSLRRTIASGQTLDEDTAYELFRRLKPAADI